MKFLRAALFVLLLVPAHQARAFDITPEIQKDLDAVSAYLEGIKTLQSDFLQITSTGETSKGKIYLERPKNLRIEYDPPTPILIVADGEYMSYVDTELKQVNHMPVADTPAALLLRKKFSFTGGGLELVDFEKSAGVIRIAVRQSKDPLAGTLTLVLNANPLVLLKWIVVDAQGTVSNVTLLNPRFDEPISKTRFIRDFPTFDLGR